MQKNVQDFEIINHGIDSSSYFQGCGVAFTPFIDIATGIGDTALGALHDAWESLAQNGWTMPSNFDKTFANQSDNRRSIEEIIGEPLNEESELHWFVSIRVK